jgi:hypothetical protein
VKLDVAIDEAYQQSGNLWDELHLRQQRLSEVQSVEEFEGLLSKLKEKQGEVNANETNIWSLHEQRDNL